MSRSRSGTSRSGRASRDNWSAGAGAAARLALAELRTAAPAAGRLRRRARRLPGTLRPPCRQACRARTAGDLQPARLAGRHASSPTAGASARAPLPHGHSLRVDRHALRAADLVVADTRASADHLAGLAGLPPERIEVAYVGAEERVFGPGWSPAEPFTVLFVGKLIPLHGVETVLAAARAAPELRFRLVGSGQLEALAARAAGERGLGPVGRLRAAPGRAPPRRLRARDLRHLGQGEARDPEQGLPGARLRRRRS